MTDKEKLEILMKEFRIGYESDKNGISCVEGGEKIAGYSGFYADFRFDDNGSFLDMAVWE